jgi:hypothetical protein
MRKLEETNKPQLKLKPTNAQHSRFLQVIKNSTKILTQYQNYAIIFPSKPCKPNSTSENTIVFGSDLGGLFIANIENESVGYMIDDNGSQSIIFCNSSLDLFISFHNSFMCLVERKIKSEPVNWEATINILSEHYANLDPTAMQTEDNFWPSRLYELSEDFFPLDDSRVSLHHALEENTHTP